MFDIFIFTTPPNGQIISLRVQNTQDCTISGNKYIGQIPFPWNILIFFKGDSENIVAKLEIIPPFFQSMWRCSKDTLI